MPLQIFSRPVVKDLDYIDLHLAAGRRCGTHGQVELRYPRCLARVLRIRINRRPIRIRQTLSAPGIRIRMQGGIK